MAAGDPLFVKHDLSASLENQLRELHNEIAQYPADQLLTTGLERLLDYFEEKYRVDVPVLDEQGTYFDQQETQVDVRYEQNRFISDRSRPALVPGSRYEFVVPFEGDSVIFNCRASTFSYNPPRALVKNDTLIFRYERTDHNAEALRAAFQHDLEHVKTGLGWARGQAGPFNASLRGTAKQAIEARRNRLLADREVAAAIGIPLKRRDNETRTYAANVRRKAPVSPPRTSTKPYVPEPALEMAEYDHILAVVQDMIHVMERSPHAFSHMKEPGIRDHILVQLNGQYEGQATGETFNFDGKTDILIRADGRNIFIAECKFWDGPKSLSDTIDQLLGYATWRDSKLAIVLLNRGPSFSKVLEKVPPTVLIHNLVLRRLDYPHETASRYIVHHRDDPDRELTLTVLCFNVPVG